MEQATPVFWLWSVPFPCENDSLPILWKIMFEKSSAAVRNKQWLHDCLSSYLRRMQIMEK